MDWGYIINALVLIVPIVVLLIGGIGSYNTNKEQTNRQLAYETELLKLRSSYEAELNKLADPSQPQAENKLIALPEPDKYVVKKNWLDSKFNHPRTQILMCLVAAGGWVYQYFPFILEALHLK